MQKQLKILWIDDEIDLLKPFILFLQEKGYFVDTVQNGQDGIARITMEPFDLVLLDEMMPGLDGLSTLQKIKKIKPSVKIVMVTKNKEEGLIEDAIAHHISDYLIKPIEPTQIIVTIKKLFKANEIIFNKAGQDYSCFVAELNQRLQDKLDWYDWADIYMRICKWDILLDDLNDEALKQTHFLQKRDCNMEFCQYIEKNYKSWLYEDDRPVLSFDLVSRYVVPELSQQAPVFFMILDCLRMDQFLCIEPFFSEFFDIDIELYYSILPTATPYSRNSIFSGMLPDDIANMFPQYWVGSSENENSRNRHEHQLLKEHLDDLGHHLNPPSKYTKIFNMDEGNFVLRKIDTYKKEKLVVLVYNFIDLIAHHRSKDPFLSETIPDEEAFRSFTRHWFQHSSLYETIKAISQIGGTLIVSSDHGSMKVNRVTKVVGDKDTSMNIRYKEGRNLAFNENHAFGVKDPKEFGLPARNIVENFIFAKDDYYFVYHNQFHQYQKQFDGTYQHGGISMYEMILPVAVCKPTKGRR